MRIYNLEEIIVKGAHDIERNTLMSHFDYDYVKEKFDERAYEMRSTDEYEIARHYCQTVNAPREFSFWIDENSLNEDYEYRLEIVENAADVQTVFEECQKCNLTNEDTHKDGFESRFEHNLGKVIIESNNKAVEGDSTLEDMLYNSGEFTIVFQCDDPTKTVATCLPYEAESYNQLVEAIRNFIKNSY